MQTVMAIVFCVGMLSSAALVYRSLRWSFDSPVLRRALRSRKFGSLTWLGIGLVTLGAVGMLFQMGARAVAPETLFFAGMMMLFGWLGVMFASLLLEDIREVFYVATGQVKSPLEKWREPDDSDHLNFDETIHNCLAEPTCHYRGTACGPGGVIPARRPAGRRRTGQHR